MASASHARFEVLRPSQSKNSKNFRSRGKTFQSRQEKHEDDSDDQGDANDQNLRGAKRKAIELVSAKETGYIVYLKCPARGCCYYEDCSTLYNKGPTEQKTFRLQVYTFFEEYCSVCGSELVVKTRPRRETLSLAAVAEEDAEGANNNMETNAEDHAAVAVEGSELQSQSDAAVAEEGGEVTGEVACAIGRRLRFKQSRYCHLHGCHFSWCSACGW